MSNYRIGIDIGGTKTEVALLGGPKENPTVVARERFLTKRELGYENYLNSLTDFLTDFSSRHQFQPNDISFMGAGLPGAVHPTRQVMLQGNTNIFKEKHILQDVIQKLGWSPKIKTYIDNDANCFLLAEYHLGAVQQWQSNSKVPYSEICVVALTLGTGLGGSMIMRNQVIHGSRGGAGELGHLTLVTQGRKCYCGKLGCAEMYLSGTGIENSYRLRMPHEANLSARQVFDLARQGDPICKAVLQEALDLWVTFLSNLANVFDPHVFVIGGGVSHEPELYAGISDRLSAECFLTADPPSVLPNHLGDAAGSVGAALLGGI